ncbi:hypothetical protein ACRALDRAFT_1073892 [Sodiomyces alcalophilus JCM 7366]|uniref:uncharacterized protein n=1 Tax=Sodiomyces alcalophilus JCM 7366 TaxID=591952 RepID=UPI0039B4955E
MSSPAHQPAEPGSEVPHQQARTLLSTFTTFLTLTLHTILYHRGLYPRETFLLAKHHNLPVPQSRHPGLCAWISDAVEHIQPLLAAGSLAKVCINTHLPRTLDVAERWVFDVRQFPTWAEEGAKPGAWEEKDRRERRTRRPLDEEELDELERERAVNWVDVDEAIRGALRRIAYAAETKGLLPEGSTFTVAVELRDEAPAPIEHSQPWIPTEPALQPASRSNPVPGSAIGGTSSTPLRTVQAGPLFFECWVEEAQAPPQTADDSTQTSWFS